MNYTANCIEVEMEKETFEYRLEISIVIETWLDRLLSGNDQVKGTVHQYQSHSIMYYFTGSEIITKPKVCVIL